MKKIIGQLPSVIIFQQTIMRRCFGGVFLFFSLSALYGQTPHLLKKAEDSLAAPVIQKAEKINPTTVQLVYTSGQRLSIDFYSGHIFRLFQDPNGEKIHPPHAEPPAQILVDQPREKVQRLQLSKTDSTLQLQTEEIRVVFGKENGLFYLFNASGRLVAASKKPVQFKKDKVTLVLQQNKKEHFYGGGLQNGFFSHKGRKIAIENENDWTSGGVASPTPFFWSTGGYGMLWNTFTKGSYDFGSRTPNSVTLSHNTPYLDVFFMIDNHPVTLFQDYYQLTGNPVLLPKFGFYEGHLNAYNRDYWKADSTGILFEDGKHYSESQKNNGGIKESLNGENDNYLFSARAVIDRYNAYDMPLGWILPNDGYGAGYGQANTLNGNIANLSNFADYAQEHGVKIGLWTQSDLYPIDSLPALLQRDLVKEVRDAGVRVLKTDVAWVGRGYSFGLNGIAKAGRVMTYYGHDARPFIITIDGWAGTQRYAAVWTGDQTGGEWEYIRFHIPTYIGAGLSGQPNVTSDMDGIFGGGNPIINTRDYQWKTFTPMELNMDGWGKNPKYPQVFGEPTTSINRFYLKLKSSLLPYTYSIAHKAVNGLPIMRAMMLNTINAYTKGPATKYQYMYGPFFLVAPIYQNTDADSLGNDIRNGIYLPKGQWIDFFTGKKYTGGRILNNFHAPLWKLPVFVKNGAIIPLTIPHNNVTEIPSDLRVFSFYPGPKTSFTLYNDDGVSTGYIRGEFTTTLLTAEVKKHRAFLSIAPTRGIFNGFVPRKATQLKVSLTQKPRKIKVQINGKRIRLKEVHSKKALDKTQDSYFYNPHPNRNHFATPGSSFAQVYIPSTPVLWISVKKHNIKKTAIKVELKGYYNKAINPVLSQTGPLLPPHAHIEKKQITPYSLNPTWQPVKNADYYEISFKGMLYSTITIPHLLFDHLQPKTRYHFKIRAVNKTGKSDWYSFSGKTKDNPLKYSLRGISGQVSVASQTGQELPHLFNFDENDLWHTQWQTTATPFTLNINLHSITTLDKLMYLPRNTGQNGNFLKGKVYYANDKDHWHLAGTFNWENNRTAKIFSFPQKPIAQYIKIKVDHAVGDFGSGRELYVFKVPHTSNALPGDINHDRLINANDITAYRNYMGLRKIDNEFNGYVSLGDVNKNGLIDAYDLANVTVQMNGHSRSKKTARVAGSLYLVPSKKEVKAGESVEIAVMGKDLNAVNALSFALPYNQKDWHFEGLTDKHLAGMTNFTKDRLHSNATKALYPTFINIGDQKTLHGTKLLFKIRFKAKRNTPVRFHLRDGILVDKQLHSVAF